METFGVKDLMKRYAVGEHTILGWIRDGHLKAINCGRILGKRPKWRITREALEAFEKLRSSPTAAPATSAIRHRKPKSSSTKVIEFYK